jgi:hypothetical protein
VEGGHIGEEQMGSVSGEGQRVAHDRRDSVASMGVETAPFENHHQRRRMSHAHPP